MGINVLSQDVYWMTKALALAQKAEEEGEVPVGAVVVDAKQSLIGTGWNQVIQRHDPSAHAEVIALREAALMQKNHRLLEATLYVTLEPCSMCAGLLVHARIHRLVYATRDIKTGAAGSLYNLLNGAHLNHRVLIDEGPLQEPCARLLQQFFEKRR